MPDPVDLASTQGEILIYPDSGAPEPSELTSAPSSASAFPFVRIIGAAGEETEVEFLAALASFR